MMRKAIETSEKATKQLPPPPPPQMKVTELPFPTYLCGTLNTRPYATPVEKKTLNAVAAVAHAEPAPAFHSPGLSLGASAGNVNIKIRNKGSSTMVVPVRRRLRTKTPPAAAQRVPEEFQDQTTRRRLST